MRVFRFVSCIVIVPRHIPRPFSIGTPLLRYIRNVSTFAESNHFARICFSDAKVFFVNGSGIFFIVYIPSDNIYISISRIPAIVIGFGSPYPDKIIDPFSLECFEHQYPKCFIRIGIFSSPPEPASCGFMQWSPYYRHTFCLQSQ